MTSSIAITSVTFILVGNMLITYNNIGVGWTAILTAIFGYILFFVGLSRLKTSLDEIGQNGVSKIIWATIIGIVALLMSYIPIAGGFLAGILTIIAFILQIVGLLKLKKSSSIGLIGANGVNYLLIAMVIMIMTGLFSIIPFVGGPIKSVFAFVAFLIIPFGWIKIQEGIIEKKD
ncbi:MAG: hypothetical protein GX459_01340 [Bacteroidales bacterium]|nr:hypothetical protein [Bacteroidales bacterium]